MKFLFASDSFKGTLSSARIAELLTTRQKNPFRIVSVPVLRLQTEEKVQRMLYCLQFRGSGFHLWCAGLSGKKQTAFTENWMKNVRSWKWRLHPVFHC